MKHSESIDQIMPALIKAKSVMGKAVKDKTNDHFKSEYVTLSGVLGAAVPALLASDIMPIQTTEATESGNIVLHTRLIHASGQWIGGTYPVHPVKPGPQNEGSALTYARRYGLMAVLSMAPEDDDGNAAQAAAQDGPDPLAIGGLLWKHKASINEIVGGLEEFEASGDFGYLSSAAEAWCEIPEEDRHGIWIAPTKAQAMGIDPPFTTRQREIIKSTEFREAAKPYIQEKAA